MAELKQISLEFEGGGPDKAVETMPEAGAKKRGRKPKPAPTYKLSSKRGRLSLKEADATVEQVEVPEDEILFQKQYYSIGQVADMFRVNHSLIRLWSKEFDAFIQTRKNKKGDRYYRPEDVKTLQLIHYLLRQRKFTMEGAKEHLRQHKNADARFAMVRSLEKIKSFLLEVKASL